MMLPRKKKIIICASVLLAAAVLLSFVGTALADPPAPVSSNQGSGIGTTLGGAGGLLTGLLATPGLVVWSALLVIVQALASAVLFIVSFFLDNIFNYSVILTPGNMPAVREGWAVMRDIANSIFILIILWIAFTIIFNVEKQGTQKLLVRVIIIALLINFSLTFVSVVFGVANALAKPFRDAIVGQNNNQVASIIVGRVRLQSVFETPTQATVSTYNSLGGATDKNCGFASLAPGSSEVGCYLGAETVDFANTFVKGFTSGADLFGGLSRSVGASISIVFLSLAILAFIIASATLLIRLVAMVFLSVLAPAAFIAAAIPNNKAQQLWNKWLSELFCWAFYAPAFYFLFWLSLRMLEAMTDNLPEVSPGNFSAFIIAMLPFVVFFVFLWASVRIGKYIGCEGAGIAIDWGKKLGGLALAGATGGAAALATQGLARVMPPEGRINKFLTRAATTPGLRWLGGAYPQRLASRFVGQRQQVIDKQEKDVAAFSLEQLLADYSASVMPERKVAILRRIAKEGWMKQFEGKYGQEGVQRGLDIATRYGAQGPILEEMPHLATKENVINLPDNATDTDAKNVVVKRIKDRVKIRKEVYRDASGSVTAAGKDVLRGIMLNTSISELSEIGRKNADLQGALQEFIDDDANITGLMYDAADPNSAQPANRLRWTQAKSEQISKYLHGTMSKARGAKAVGWKPGAVPAPAAPGTPRTSRAPRAPRTPPTTPPEAFIT